MLTEAEGNVPIGLEEKAGRESRGDEWKTKGKERELYANGGKKRAQLKNWRRLLRKNGEEREGQWETKKESARGERGKVGFPTRVPTGKNRKKAQKKEGGLEEALLKTFTHKKSEVKSTPRSSNKEVSRFTGQKRGKKKKNNS